MSSPFNDTADTASANNHTGNSINNDETMTTSSIVTSSQQGIIDIRTALEILSERSRPINQHRYRGHFASSPTSGCPHCVDTTISEEAKSMGQTILLHEEGANEANRTAAPTITDQENLEEKRKALAEERSKRQVEIKTKLQSMSVSELIQAVLEAQRQRVATYREFDCGLDRVLQTGNMSEYPVICACATASFAVLSDTITTIQSIVRPQKRNAAQLIAKLQAQERDKLNVTAALHLERIRFESSTNATDDSVRYLLQEGVQSLRAKATTCIEQINEILEEIRMEVVDDNDN